MNTKIIKYTVKELVKDVENGMVRVPVFQREFVWKKEQVIRLLDSLYNNFPISSILLCKLNIDVEYYSNFFDYEYKKTDSNVGILDGQQRILSLLGCKLGIETPDFDFKNIYLDISEIRLEEEYNDKTFKYSQNIDGSKVTIHNILNNDITFFFDICSKYSKNDSEYELMLERIIDIKETILNYQLNVTETIIDDLVVATDIFEKINITSKKVTNEDMIFAKLYINSDKDSDFDFEEYLVSIEKSFKKSFNKSIAKLDIVSILSQIITRKKGIDSVEQITSEKLIANADNIKRAFNYSHKFIKTILRIDNLNDLPNIKLIYILLGYFYIDSNFEPPTPKQIKDLRKIYLDFCITKYSVEQINTEEKVLSFVTQIVNNNFQENIIRNTNESIFERCFSKRRTMVSKSIELILLDNNKILNYSITGENLLDTFYFDKPFNEDNLERLFIDKDFIEINSLQGVRHLDYSRNKDAFYKERFDNIMNKLYS